MSIDKKSALIALVWFVIGGVCGFFVGKGMYDQPIKESITRDTIRLTDTIPHYYPQPVDGTEVKTVYKWLTRVQTDTVSVCFRDNSVSSVKDSVLVEVPITSKHYHSEEYDAYISGFEPNLDSIFVYQKKEIITNTITRTVKDSKHFFLDVGAGCEYKFNEKSAVPFAELGIKFKPGRFGIGAYGGYSHDINENKGLPYAKAKITYDIISF